MAVERARSRSPSQPVVEPAGPPVVLASTSDLLSSVHVWARSSNPSSVAPRRPSPTRFPSDVVGTEVAAPARRPTTPVARITSFDALSSGGLSVNDESLVLSSAHVWAESNPLSTLPRSPSPTRSPSDVTGTEAAPPVRRATTPEARITWFDSLLSSGLSVNDASLDAVFDRSSGEPPATPFERALQGSVEERGAAMALAQTQLIRKGNSIFRSIGRCGKRVDFDEMWDVASDHADWSVSKDGLLESALQGAASATGPAGTCDAAEAIIKRAAFMAKARRTPPKRKLAGLGDLLEHGRPDLIIDLLQSGWVHKDVHHDLVTLMAREGQLDVTCLTRLHEKLQIDIGTRLGRIALISPAQSPLACVARHGQLDAVRYIVDHVEEYPEALQIAAASAARHGHWDVIVALAAKENARDIASSKVYSLALYGALGEEIAGAGVSEPGGVTPLLVEKLLTSGVVPSRGNLSRAAELGDVDAVGHILDAGMLNGREHMKLDRRWAMRMASWNYEAATNPAEQARYVAVVTRLRQHLADFPSSGGVQLLTTALSRFGWGRSAPVVAPERQPLLGDRR